MMKSMVRSSRDHRHKQVFLFRKQRQTHATKTPSNEFMGNDTCATSSTVTTAVNSTPEQIHHDASCSATRLENLRNPLPVEITMIENCIDDDISRLDFGVELELNHHEESGIRSQDYVPMIISIPDCASVCSDSDVSSIDMGSVEEYYMKDIADFSTERLSL